jgi:hypothetical protein
MGVEWAINISSLWVVAPPAANIGGPEKRFLADYRRVMRVVTTAGAGVPLFDDQDLAERYVRDGALSDYEPATFEKPYTLACFLLEMQRMKTACFVMNPTFGISHVRLYPLERAVRDLGAVFSAKRPPDQGPGQRPG